jgi:flagellar biogenesis protein FliO
VVTTISSLALVLGLFLASMWALRRGTRLTMMPLPEGVVEVLGRTSLAGRQQLYLVRLGNKLLLLAVTPDSAETLAEMTDQTEIDRIVGLCQHNRPGSVAASFRQVLTQLNHPSRAERLDATDSRKPAPILTHTT